MQHRPIHFDPYEVTDQVVARRHPPLCHDPGEVVAQRCGGGDAPFPIGRHAGQLKGPTLEARIVGPRQPEDVGDHLRRKIERHLTHQIGATPIDEGVDQFVHDHRDQALFPMCEHL